MKNVDIRHVSRWSYVKNDNCVYTTSGNSKIEFYFTFVCLYNNVFTINHTRYFINCTGLSIQYYRIVLSQ